MARVKVHTPCMRPLRECDCPPDDDDEPDGLISLNPPAPVPYDGPVRDADGTA